MWFSGIDWETALPESLKVGAERGPGNYRRKPVRFVSEYPEYNSGPLEWEVKTFYGFHHAASPWRARFPGGLTRAPVLQKYANFRPEC